MVTKFGLMIKIGCSLLVLDWIKQRHTQDRQIPLYLWTVTNCIIIYHFNNTHSLNESPKMKGLSKCYDPLWTTMDAIVNLSCNYYHFNYPGSQHMGLFSATWLITLQRQVSCCLMMGQLDFASTNNPRWSLPPKHNQRSRETLRIDVTEKVFYSFPIVKCQIFFTGVSAFKQN